MSSGKGSQCGLTSKVGEEDGLGKHGLANPHQQQQKLRVQEVLDSRLDLEPGILTDSQADLLPIPALDLVRRGEQGRHERATGLDGNKDEIHRVRHGARLITVRVEAEIDRPAEDLADKTIREPVAQRFPAIPRLRIGNGDCSF